MAFIEFSEFIEFTSAYGVEWDLPPTENDLEAMLDKKLNQSYKDYKVTKKDYFNDCKTILTSEKAALAKCTQIFEENLQKRKQGIQALKFLDLDFGPVRESDDHQHRFSLYKTGEVPRKGYPDPRKVKWVYAEEICGGDAQFVDDGAASSDCIQGNLGDCWFISALSVLATRDDLLVGGERGLTLDPDMVIGHSLTQKLSSGVWPPIFHRFREIGLYVLRFFKNFQWVYVIVDERIPVDKDTKMPVFGRCKNKNEIWVPLIEKAYAKLHGCYENLISGYIDEGI